MPYRIKRGAGPKPFKIVRADTGKVVGASSTEGKARASIRARLAGEHGWRPGPRRRGARKR